MTVNLHMGEDRGAAAAAFAAPVPCFGTVCRTNKIRGYNTKKNS